MNNMTKSWLKRDFKEGTIFRMPVRYLVNHLSSYDKNKVYGGNDPAFEAWQGKKEKGICSKLDSGISPSRIDPIRVNIHPAREEFYVADGISRIRAYRRKGIKSINAIMGYY